MWFNQGDRFVSEALEEDVVCLSEEDMVRLQVLSEHNVQTAVGSQKPLEANFPLDYPLHSLTGLLSPLSIPSIPRA